MNKIFRLILLFVSLAAVGYLLRMVMFTGMFEGEQENIVAGWLIGQGYSPYRDFFLRTNPLPLFLSYIIQSLNWGFELYRWFIAIFYLLVFGVVSWSINMRTKVIIFLTVLVLIPMMPLLRMNMFLAESFYSISILAMIALVVSNIMSSRPSNIWVIRAFFVFGFVAIWSSTVAGLTFALIFICWIFARKGLIKEIWGELNLVELGLWFGFIFSIPILFFVLGSFSEFWWSVIGYNSKFYFHLRLNETMIGSQLGIFYRMFHQFFLFVRENGVLIWDIAKTYLGSLQSVLSNYYSTYQVYQFESGIRHTHQVFFERLQNPVLMGFLTMIVFLINSFRVKKWFLLIGLFFMILLRAQAIDFFEFSSFYVVLIFGLVMFMIETVMRDKKIFFFVNMFSILLMIFSFWPSFSEAWEKKKPIISSQQLYKGMVINSELAEDESLLIISENPIYYQLSDHLPSNKFLSYYPWYADTSIINESFTQEIEQRKVDVIFHEAVDNDGNLPNDNYASELMKKIKKNYTYQSNGIFVRNE